MGYSFKDTFWHGNLIADYARGIFEVTISGPTFTEFNFVTKVGP